ncbi:MAG: hypothetical protein RL136_2238 [Planctomycetota bacterium]|jgi:hypothetical protein
MKVVWTIVALLLVGGLFVLFQPPRQEQPLWKQAMEEPASVQREAERTTEPPTPPAKTAGTSVFDEPAPSGAASASPAAPSTATAAGTKSDSKPEPSAEPKRPSAEAVAAGSTFEPEIPDIPEAELLPSRFVKLADGSISVDDAWTIRGEGTTDEPYEISWEFLASAQEDYMPRLGERKLPARIAFLSGKHVKISGYLAFPLVAPTSSECLLMLNQWDGCCIGVPPTPYDAVEVRLTSEVKGWKKHTINFGAIEGVFRVEPYLVENWLVGLYLIDEGVLDTEI